MEISEDRVIEIMRTGAEVPSFHSSLAKIVETNPQYSYIDGLGEAALPGLRKLLAEDFEDNLVVIYLLGKHEPDKPDFPEESRGRVKDLREIWLQFFQAHPLA